MIDEAEIKSKNLLIGLGKAMRELRKQKNMTQNQLANRAGLSQPVLCRIERGGFYSLKLLCLVAEALDVEIEVNFLKKSPANSKQQV